MPYSASVGLEQKERNVMEFKGSKTERNLVASFAGESQARNRYTYYADKAKEEGYIQISAVFEETANQEREHAERYFKILQENNASNAVKVEAEFPARPLGKTEENLRAAAAGEHYETTSMYPGFADIADKEGFSRIAAVWRAIGRAEAWHEQRYTILADNVAKGRVFKRETKVKWRCQNCGYIHEGLTPPEKCPACDYPKSYYMIHSAEF